MDSKTELKNIRREIRQNREKIAAMQLKRNVCALAVLALSALILLAGFFARGGAR